MSKTSNTAVPTPQEVAPTPAPVFSVPYEVTNKIKVSPYYTSFVDSYDQKFDEMISYNEAPVSAPSYEAPVEVKKEKAKKVLAPGSVKKRGFIVFLVLLFMVVVLAVGVLGFIGLEFTNDYVGIFNTAGKTVYFHDPIFGAVEAWGADLIEEKLGDSVYYDNYLSTLQTDNVAVKISSYVLPIALVLIALFALIVVIKALVALFGKKARKLGFLSLLIAIFGLFVAGCGVIWNNMGISQIISVLTGEAANVNATYGLYALIGLPLIAAILSAFAYKKIK